jgi:hypothetical protein
VLESTNFQTDYVATILLAADTYTGVIERANAIRSPPPSTEPDWEMTRTTW